MDPFGQVSTASFRPKPGLQKAEVNRELVLGGPENQKYLSEKQLNQATFLAMEGILALADCGSETTARNIRTAVALLHPEIVLPDAILKQALESGTRTGKLFHKEFSRPHSTPYKAFEINIRMNLNERDHNDKFVQFVHDASYLARDRINRVNKLLREDPRALAKMPLFKPDPLLDPSKSRTGIVTFPIPGQEFLPKEMAMSWFERTGKRASGLSLFYIVKGNDHLADADDDKPVALKFSLPKGKGDPMRSALDLGGVGAHPLGQEVLRMRALTQEEVELLRRDREESGALDKTAGTYGGVAAEYVDLMAEFGHEPKRERFSVSGSSLV